jgi:hypothetical protein
MTLDQEQYLNTMPTKFGVPNAKYKEKKIPIADYKQTRPANDKDIMINVNEFQQWCGRFIYPMTITRLDICFAMERLAQYMSSPAEHHGHSAKGVMRYLGSTIKQKLHYGPGKPDEDHIAGYTDADWASDNSDRKSISGGVVMFYGGPISWLSKKQNSVATSTAESEYISMATNVKQGQWMGQVLRDMNMGEFVCENEHEVKPYGDNQGAIALTKKPHLHERSKHIDICYHFIRDLVEKELVNVEYVPTVEMVADGMTKPLERVAFERFKRQLGVVDSGKVNLFIDFISFNVIQPMWLCRQILTHKIADMSERRKQANKQKKTKQHT